MTPSIHWILSHLERAEPYPLPESALFVEMNNYLRPPMERAAFGALLAKLERDKMIARIEEKYADEPVWLIREAGKALLRK